MARALARRTGAKSLQGHRAQARRRAIRRRVAPPPTPGELDLLESGNQTLADFAQEWWQLYAIPNFGRKTLRVYASLWDRHVLPRLGAMQLREIRPEVINRLMADLHGQGLAPGTIRKVVALLQGVLQRAVEWGRIQQNPARLVRKPTTKRRRDVTALSPRTVESIRDYMLRKGRRRDATLVSLLAYAGVRPGEALALRWADIGERTVSVYASKTRSEHTARLVAPLAADLAEWRLASGRPGENALVFPGREGGPSPRVSWNSGRRASAVKRRLRPERRARERTTFGTRT